MQTASTVERADSSVPGVMPEPVRVHDDATEALPRVAAVPATGDVARSAPSPSHRSTASVAFTKLLGISCGDKYIVDAYPPAWHKASTTREVNDGIGLDHHDVMPEQSTVAPEQSMAEPARPSAPADPTTMSVVRTGS